MCHAQLNFKVSLPSRFSEFGWPSFWCNSELIRDKPRHMPGFGVNNPHDLIGGMDQVCSANGIRQPTLTLHTRARSSAFVTMERGPWLLTWYYQNIINGAPSLAPYLLCYCYTNNIRCLTKYPRRPEGVHLNVLTLFLHYWYYTSDTIFITFNVHVAIFGCLYILMTCNFFKKIAVLFLYTLFLDSAVFRNFYLLLWGISE